MTVCLLCYRYVQEVADEHVAVQISSALKGRISILDSADEPDKLNSFAQQFTEGQPIQCRVSQVQSPESTLNHSTCLNMGPSIILCCNALQCGIAAKCIHGIVVFVL